MISVITPVKNGEQYLQRALDSLDQQNVAFEYVIVDGMSTDATHAIIELNMHRISKVIRAPDNTATEALNRGISESQGEIICLLMSDDWLPEGALAAIGNGFQDNPNAELLLGSTQIVDETDSSAQTCELLYSALPALDITRLLGTPYAAAYSFRRSLWNRLGGFKQTYRYGADRDFLMRCLLSGSAAGIVEETTYSYSANANSDTLGNNPAVIEAFLQDHLIMVEDWLESFETPKALRSEITTWRRRQVNELFAVRSQRSGYLSGLKLEFNAVRSDPIQLLSFMSWVSSQLNLKIERMFTS